MKHTQFSAAILTAAGFFFCLDGVALAQKGVNADTPGHAVTTGSGQTRGDMHFAREAAEGGMLEVKLGQLAVQKSSNDMIKAFGQRMIDDHTKANDELKSIAAKDNINLPTGLDAKDMAIVERFSKMNGTEFDRVYPRDMVRDHENDIAEFQKEANDGTNPDLKNFASSTLPILQQHLQLAKENMRAMGITSSRENPNRLATK